jgi:hypothetical protein
MADFLAPAGTPGSLKFVFEAFVIPLNQALETLYNNGERGPELYQLASLSSEAISIYEDMQKQIEEVAKDIKQVAEEVKEKGLDKLRGNAGALGIQVPDEPVN